jgi:ABC-2 type transport system permease protein
MTRKYILSEVRITLRNRRMFIFGLLLPVVFLLVFGKGQEQIGGLNAAPFFMVSMATFGAMNGVFGTGGKVALERSIGWNRQLRLTALSGPSYVIAKLITGFVVAIPSIVVVYALSALKSGVHLSAEMWIGSAVAILLAMIPIGVFGVAIGYIARPDSVQAISGGLFTILSFLGGIWYPINQMPHWLQDVSKLLPTTWSASAGHDVLMHTWIGLEGVSVLVAWTIGLGALAAWAYRRDTLRV